jgi:hypothetical protein
MSDGRARSCAMRDAATAVARMGSDEVKVLEKVYADVVNERDRLRGARAAVTRQLGPLPASAAIVLGLVGVASHAVAPGFLIAAAGLFFALMLVSIALSSLIPYRLLRGRKVLDERSRASATEPPPRPAGTLPATYIGETVEPDVDYATWLGDKIRFESELYGPLRRSQYGFFGHRDLQRAFDIERAALNVVQLLFAAIILVLLAGIIAHLQP